MRFIKSAFKSYFVTGLLVFVPLAATLWVARWMFFTVDRIFPMETWLGFKIPGLGLVVVLATIMLCGIIGRNVLGVWMFSHLAEWAERIPVIGAIYNSLRQLMTSLLSQPGQRFGRAVLVRYPHSESWTIGFVTVEKAPIEIARKLDETVTCVFIPTTPNPTSGFFVFVPVDQVKSLDITVDQAFKILISLGLAGSRNR